MWRRSLLLLCLLLLCCGTSFLMSNNPTPSAYRLEQQPSPRVSTSRGGATTTTTTTRLFGLSPERKRTLLSRTGPYFSLDRGAGTIEFGATAQLTTPLAIGDDDPTLVSAWLQDAASIAQSIWDPSLTTALGKNVYRLETVPLQFVTLQIAPSVDVEMKTILSKSNQQPIFTLQSVAFNPNIQVIPGMPPLDAKALGIVIETAGYLQQQQQESAAVSGLITFQTSGFLPPPLRLLPDAVLERRPMRSINKSYNWPSKTLRTARKPILRPFENTNSSSNSRGSGGMSFLTGGLDYQDKDKA